MYLVQPTVEEASRRLPVTAIAHPDQDRGQFLDQGGVDLVRCLVRVVLLHRGQGLLQYQEDTDLPVFSIGGGLQGKIFMLV